MVWCKIPALVVMVTDGDAAGSVFDITQMDGNVLKNIQCCWMVLKISC